MIALVVASMLASMAVAGEADVVQKLGEALKGVATYEYGKDHGPLRQAEDLVVEAAKDPKLLARAEAQLLDGLKAAKTNDAKAFLCRQLRTIGSDRAVPALAAMLTDAKLSHMARYALGRIEGDVATKALRDALGKTSGKIQAGVIGTLANRRDAAALPVLGKLLGSQDVMVAGAAAGAIGRIGGTDAARMLMSARSKAKGQVLERVNDGLLACADQLLEDRKKAEAGKIYEMFFAPKEPKHLRTAALRGLVAARGAAAAPLLVEAIKGDDPQLRSSAIGFVQSVKGAEATQAFAALLPSLAPEGQELLVRSLAARGDVSARPAVLAATKSQEESVRVAALEGLGTLGDASCVGILAEAASKGGAPQGAARRALALLRGDDVNQALVGGIGKGDAKVRVELVRALAARRCTKAVPQVLAVAKDDDSSVRREAIRALGVLAGEADLPDLLKLAIKPK
ncbi:HEAT repeat domain-containing protein, partial [bacterium]|nr:HEAT repeat domain-containing protein [bacterium]